MISPYCWDYGDIGLRTKSINANDLNTALALAHKAGFDSSKARWLKYQAMQVSALSEEAP